MLNYNLIQEYVYLLNESKERPNRLNALLFDFNEGKNAVLIDANFPFGDIDQVYETISAPAHALLFSHCHLDHTAHAFYHQSQYETPIYVPEKESHYLTSLEDLMVSVGFDKLNLRENYEMLVKKYMKYQECENVNTFCSGKDSFYYEDFQIETISIPGHSPGHTAFKITFSIDKSLRPILYVADIGSHPYYGDLNSDLSQYRISIDKLESIYNKEDFILIPAHGTYYIEEEPEFFNRIRQKIKKNEERVWEALSNSTPKTIRQLVSEHIITPKKRKFPPIKNLYQLWDGGMIYQHLQEFIQEGKVERIEQSGFLSDKYIRR